MNYKKAGRKVKKVVDTLSKAVVQTMGVNMDWTEERKLGKKVLEKAKNTVNKVKSVPGKILDKVEEKNKGVNNARRERDKAMMKDNFGSIENYEELQKSEKKLKNKKKK